MTYTETLSEMIKGNTQDCVEELQDIKSAIEMLNKRAAKNIEAKKDSLYEKIENWNCDDDIDELALWLNELRELVGYDDFKIPFLDGCCIKMDIYHRIESIFPLVTCNMDDDVLYQDEDGKFIVEGIESLSKKHLTEADKRAVAHERIDNMMDWQLDNLLIYTMF